MFYDRPRMAPGSVAKGLPVPTGDIRPRSGTLRQVMGRWQIVLILVVWAFVAGLHWDNDGLWFQGDAPRHAANGLFWQSYLGDFTFEARDYAISYYARYPAINPVKYPPFFYLVEAGAFAIFGPSGLLAKWLVLVFALIATLYLFAWLRRWVSPKVGWLAALLLLQPGVVLWSHAVMLNIPAVALTLAALYHARRWPEEGGFSPRTPQFYLPGILCMLAFLTYWVAGFVVLVILALVFAKGDWRRFARWRTLLWALACLPPLVICYLFLVRSTPHLIQSLVSGSAERFWELRTWLYYLKALPLVFEPTLLALSAAGWVVGLSVRRWRRETLVVTVWSVVIYGVFSILYEKDPRYILFLGPPLVCAGALGVAWIAERLAGLTAKQRLLAQAARVAGVVTVLALPARSAWAVAVPVIDGLHEVATFLGEVAPDEPVLYDGHYNGVFTFHIQADDPDYRRRVVLGNKLFYTYAIWAGVQQKEFVSSPEEVVEVLRTEGGCRWLAVEYGEYSRLTTGQRLVRQAVRRPEFELVRSFPIEAEFGKRVDVFRILGPISEQTKVRMPVPSISSDAVFEAEPIMSRSRR